MPQCGKQLVVPGRLSWESAVYAHRLRVSRKSSFLPRVGELQWEECSLIQSLAKLLFLSK